MEKLTQMVQKMLPPTLSLAGGIAMGSLAAQTSILGAVIALGLVGTGLYLGHKNKQAQ